MSTASDELLKTIKRLRRERNMLLSELMSIYRLLPEGAHEPTAVELSEKQIRTLEKLAQGVYARGWT